MAGVRMPELPPATAGVGRGQWPRYAASGSGLGEPLVHTPPPLADLLEAAVGGVVGKAKVWECSERDHRSSPSGTMQEPGGPELLLRQSLAAAEEPFACPGASALSPDREVSRQASGDCSRTERAALGAGCEVVF